MKEEKNVEKKMKYYNVHIIRTSGVQKTTENWRNNAFE